MQEKWTAMKLVGLYYKSIQSFLVNLKPLMLMMLTCFKFIQGFADINFVQFYAKPNEVLTDSHSFDTSSLTTDSSNSLSC